MLSNRREQSPSPQSSPVEGGEAGGSPSPQSSPVKGEEAGGSPSPQSSPVEGEEAAEFWAGKSVVVTGGAGFLGRAVVRRIRERGADKVFVPRSADYDLRLREHVLRLLEDAAPDYMVHLAAVVGGIGANRANPGSFFYDNAIMGIHLLEEARKAGVEKILVVGTICAYPNETPVPVQGGRSLGRLSGDDQRALRARQEDAAGAGAGLPRAVRHEHRLPAAGPTCTARPTTSTPSRATSSRR